MNILKGITVEHMEGENGPVMNQFIIRTPDGVIFQSYSSIIAIKQFEPQATILDANKWDYSRATMKYLRKFLRVESKKEIEKKIKERTYLLQNLNGG